ncbi:MAG: SMC-Scp complex subunit ScpB [Patescibacteria group bacterium]
MNKIIGNKNIIEALLFFSGEPVDFDKIKKRFKINDNELVEIISELKRDYEGRGVNILEFEDTVEMVTSPDTAEFLSDFVKSELQEDLSQAALETLAIIAYREPVSRAQIDDIRGVNSTFILRNLLIRGLIKRDNNPNDFRSFSYSITLDFIKKLGLKEIKELPEYEKYVRHVTHNK